MHHLDQAGFNIGAPVTAVLPLARAVYTGDEDGRVVSVLDVPVSPPAPLAPLALPK